MYKHGSKMKCLWEPSGLAGTGRDKEQEGKWAELCSPHNIHLYEGFRNKCVLNWCVRKSVLTVVLQTWRGHLKENWGAVEVSHSDQACIQFLTANERSLISEEINNGIWQTRCRKWVAMSPRLHGDLRLRKLRGGRWHRRREGIRCVGRKHTF